MFDINIHLAVPAEFLERIMSIADTINTQVAALEAAVTANNTLLVTIHTDLVNALAANDTTALQALSDRIGAAVTSLQAADAANAEPATPTPAPVLGDQNL